VAGVLREGNTIESQQVLEWIAEGEARGRAAAEAKGWAHMLLRLLEKRFPPGAPADLIVAIRATTDLERLRQWFDLAWATASLSDFRQAAGL
jgi:hypothetical protein